MLVGVEWSALRLGRLTHQNELDFSLGRSGLVQKIRIHTDSIPGRSTPSDSVYRLSYPCPRNFTHVSIKELHQLNIHGFRSLCLLFRPATAPPPPTTVGQGHLITEASSSHFDTPQSVGHLLTSDQPYSGICT